MSAVHAERSGAGDLPLVLLHGWGMSLRAFDALRAALGVADCALDLPGHGRSGWDPSRAGFEQQLEDLARAMPERGVLLGWSLGAYFALECARRWPQRVAGLVLVAATPRFGAAPDWPHGLAPLAMEAFSATLEQDWQHTLQDFIWLQLRGSRNAETVQRQIQAGLRSHGEPQREALAADMAILGALDLRAQLADIRQPALVITGQHDRVTPPGAGAWLAAALDADHVCIPRASHAPFLSHVEETAAPIREFLARTAAAAAPLNRSPA
ncbi:MAG: alpha/beta fold hydrolase [Steroidobacteraceae bacterium]